MFKYIQNYILLKYPLSWNTKFVPMLVIGILLNAIYYAIGYANGIVDFTGKFDLNLQIYTLTGFGAILNFVVLIIWLVYYFRNNFISSFYHRNSNSFFYEYLQIFIICILLSIFPLFYITGSDEHQKSYISEKELAKNIDIICKADFFIDGEFETPEVDESKSINYDNGTSTLEYYDYVVYNYKAYNRYSLINRKTFFLEYKNDYYGSEYRDSEAIKNDSLLRNYLFTKNKSAIKKIMSEYLEILKKHQLKTNLTVGVWFNALYDYPKFINYKLIKPFAKLKKLSNNKINSIYNEFGINYNSPSNKEYSDLFVEQNLLIKNYSKINNAYKNSNLTKDLISILFLISFYISLLIFSYRVTSFRKWMIALLITVFLCVVSISFAMLLGNHYGNNSRNSDLLSYLFAMLILLLIFANIIYFYIITNRNKSKKNTEISLNIVLWSYPIIIPTLYFMVLNYLHIYSRDESNDLDKLFNLLEDNIFYFAIINVFLSLIFLYFFSQTIYKWKGISEN